MRKVGRNEPCPCGSGRKYKKCCLEKAAPRSAGEAGEPGGPARDASRTRPAYGLTPYTIAKIAEDPRSAGADERLRRQIERGLLTNWTISKVAALSTERIEAQLRDYGVRHSRERFLRLALGTDSAWTISEAWTEQDPLKCEGKQADFLGLAACELWKRLLPERPSIEMLDDWMQDGYRLAGEHRHAEACDVWERVWNTLRPRFAAEMTTMDAAAAAFSGMQCLFNWCQDFEMELENAASEQARYAELGRRYCLEWTAQFREESDSVQVSVRRTLAACLLRLGRVEEAASVLLSLVERWPRDVWGYVALADAHSHLFQGACNLELDLDRARHFLERGLALDGLEDRDREVLEDRLAEIERRRSCPNGAP